MRLLLRRKIKKIIIIAIIIIFAIPVLAFLPLAIGRTIYFVDYYCNDPKNFPGSIWTTENGEITFQVNDIEECLTNENGAVLLETNMVGEINSADINTKCFVNIATYAYTMALYTEIRVDSDKYDRQEMESFNYQIAYFDIDYISNKHFKAIVAGSTIFEVGTVFDFYRTDN